MNIQTFKAPKIAEAPSFSSSSSSDSIVSLSEIMTPIAKPNVATKNPYKPTCFLNCIPLSKLKEQIKTIFKKFKP